jgi:diaminopimelate decarboxylase
MDRVEAGDLIIIRTAGAYAATMGHTYNSRPLAPEVLVDASDWAVIRVRRDIEELLEDERLPPWLAPAN